MVEAPAVHFSKEEIYFVIEKEILKVNRKTNQKERFILPDDGIKSIRVYGKVIFIEVPKGIKKYSLIPK